MKLDEISNNAAAAVKSHGGEMTATEIANNVFGKSHSKGQMLKTVNRLSALVRIGAVTRRITSGKNTRVLFSHNKRFVDVVVRDKRGPAAGFAEVLLE